MPDPYALESIRVVAEDLNLPVWHVLFSLNQPIPLEYVPTSGEVLSEQVMDKVFVLLIESLDCAHMAHDAHAAFPREDIWRHWIALFEQEMMEASPEQLDAMLEHPEFVPDGEAYRRIYIHRLIKVSRSLDELRRVLEHELFDSSEDTELLVADQLVVLIKSATSLLDLSEIEDFDEVVLQLHSEYILARKKELYAKMWDAEFLNPDDKEDFLEIVRGNESSDSEIFVHFQEIFLKTFAEHLNEGRTFAEIEHLWPYCQKMLELQSLAVYRMFVKASTASEYHVAFRCAGIANFNHFRNGEGELDQNHLATSLNLWLETVSHSTERDQVYKAMLEVFDMDLMSETRQTVIAFVARDFLEKMM